jgi:hypothetical protein
MPGPARTAAGWEAAAHGDARRLTVETHTRPAAALRAARAQARSSSSRCGTCGRRLESAWSNGKPAYRCRHGYTSATRPGPGRPKNLYVREDRIMPRLTALPGGMPSDLPPVPQQGAHRLSLRRDRAGGRTRLHLILRWRQAGAASVRHHARVMRPEEPGAADSPRCGRHRRSRCCGVGAVDWKGATCPFTAP